MRLPSPAALIATAVLALVGVTPALADSSSSSNWAGYAVHRSGVRFTKVFAIWTQPNASCGRGTDSYSAIWVGLGGYRASSNALEQIGTEVDCSASGRASSSAWYELVPAASQPISLAVHPGDSIAAVVSVSGHRGTISDPAWGWTKIQLAPAGRRFVVYNGSGRSAGAATPSALAAAGSSFNVTFAKVPVQSNPFLSPRRATVQAGHLVHPGR